MFSVVETVSAIRTVLEALRCVVLRHAVGTPGDFFQAIGQGPSAAQYVVINGHGSACGLYFGEYGRSDIDTSLLREGYLPAEAIERQVHLPSCTVISLCCEGGSEAMARAFLAGRVSSYIGCRTETDSGAALVFLTNFFFRVVAKQLSYRDAWYQAVSATDYPDIHRFSYYDGEGGEERFPARSPEEDR